jgi:hypothetical protein
VKLSRQHTVRSAAQHCRLTGWQYTPVLAPQTNTLTHAAPHSSICPKEEKCGQWDPLFQQWTSKCVKAEQHASRQHW